MSLVIVNTKEILASGSVSEYLRALSLIAV